MRYLEPIYRVMFGIAWGAGLITGLARFGGLTLDQAAPGYSLCTTAFMVGAGVWATANLVRHSR